MIGINWKKSLVVAGAALAAVAAVPAMSLAHTQYTGVTPPSIAMMATAPVVKPVKKSTGTKLVAHHKTAKKASKKASVKHKSSKTHKTTGTKKKVV